MSRMNNPQSRATKADLAALRKPTLPATKADATPVVTKPKAPAKEPKEPKVPDATKVTIAQLARELKQDPKAVRARLRRAYDQDTEKKLPQPVANARQRWTFDVKDRAALVAMLTPTE